MRFKLLLAAIGAAAVATSNASARTDVPMTWEDASRAYENCLLDGLKRSKQPPRSKAALTYAKRHCSEMGEYLKHQCIFPLSQVACEETLQLTFGDLNGKRSDLRWHGLPVKQGRMDVLKIENLHAEIDGKPILNGLTLSVGAGEVHALMGPNGAGKSTLGKIKGEQS